MAPESRFVQANGLRLHYLDYGGDGPPLILYHGVTFGGFIWGPIAEILALRYHVYAPDRRGHGDSDTPDDGYTTADYAADLKGLQQGLGLGPSVGVGHSTGAESISMLAGMDPDAFSATVLIEPTLRLAPLANRPRTNERQLVFNSREEMFERYKGRGGLANWREDMVKRYIDHGTRELPDGRVELKCKEVWRSAPVSDAPRPLTWPHFTQMRCPTLIIRATRNSAFTPEAVEEARKAVPGLLIEEMEGDHNIPMEIPEDLAHRALRFLADARSIAPDRAEAGPA